MEIPGRMQVTLVSHYGDKSGTVLDLIRECQDILARLLLSAFRPYEIEQVHATIIGLEGCRIEDHIQNEILSKYGSEEKLVSPAELLGFLRSSESLPFDIRIGGYRHHEDWGFLSQKKHPYLRSFSIQGAIAVAMGWPFNGKTFPDTLDRLRRRFGDLGVLHKYHKKQDDVDNDFFFVLGRVDRRYVNEFRIQQVEEEMRLFLAGINDLIVPINRETVSVVGYLDPQLTTYTSCALRIGDAALDEKRLLNLYPDCGVAV